MNISKHHIVLSIALILLISNYFFFGNESFYWNINVFIIIILLITLYIGVTRHRLNYFFNSINSGTKKGLSLTFDDGPNPEYTEKVLDILKAKQVKAAFFIIGKNIKGNEELLKRIDEEGHIIGNHSNFHQNWFNTKLPSRIINEIDSTNQLISDIIGKSPRYFRSPFGLTSPNISKALKKTKYLSVGWDFRSFDTMSKDSNKLFLKLKKKAKQSSILLLHDNNQISLETLEPFIDYCIENGIEIVPLDEMIGQKAYK